MQHNDEAHAICQRRLGISRPGMQDLNSVLAGNLAELWLPSSPGDAQSTQDPRPASTPEIADVVGTLCASPLHKILTVRGAPYIAPSALAFSNIGWEVMCCALVMSRSVLCKSCLPLLVCIAGDVTSLVNAEILLRGQQGTLRNLRQMAITDWHLDEELDWQIGPGSGTETGRGRACKALAHGLILRGADWNRACVSLFRQSCLYAPWAIAFGGMGGVSVMGSGRRCREMERSAVLVSNTQVAHLILVACQATCNQSFADCG